MLIPVFWFEEFGPRLTPRGVLSVGVTGCSVLSLLCTLFVGAGPVLVAPGAHSALPALSGASEAMPGGEAAGPPGADMAGGGTQPGDYG